MAPDPVDIRLLALVADSGKAAVHEIAARLGMDPREVASRLVALSATGLPLIVGVECDANRLRAAIAGAHQWAPPPPQYPGPAQGHPSGPYPGPYPGSPAGPYPGAAQGHQSGPYPGAQGYPSGPYANPAQGHPSGPYPGQQRGAEPQPPAVPAPAPARVGPPSTPFPAAGSDAISTWGPPQTSAWARGDQPSAAAAPVHRGKVGDTLRTEGLDGEQVAIQLLEVVDPADFLFHAAGYRLQPGERAVVVHTELTNRGQVPYPTLPDLYLVLVSETGEPVRKAPVSLSARTPHRIGVPPGETAGGHTVYVLPENTRITAVRWSPRPDDELRALTWLIDP